MSIVVAGIVVLAGLLQAASAHAAAVVPRPERGNALEQTDALEPPDLHYCTLLQRSGGNVLEDPWAFHLAGVHTADDQSVLANLVAESDTPLQLGVLEQWRMEQGWQELGWFDRGATAAMQIGAGETWAAPEALAWWAVEYVQYASWTEKYSCILPGQLYPTIWYRDTLEPANTLGSTIWIALGVGLWDWVGVENLGPEYYMGVQPGEQLTFRNEHEITISGYPPGDVYNPWPVGPGLMISYPTIEGTIPPLGTLRVDYDFLPGMHAEYYLHHPASIPARGVAPYDYLTYRDWGEYRQCQRTWGEDVPLSLGFWSEFAGEWPHYLAHGELSGSVLLSAKYHYPLPGEQEEDIFTARETHAKLYHNAWQIEVTSADVDSVAVEFVDATGTLATERLWVDPAESTWVLPGTTSGLATTFSGGWTHAPQNGSLKVLADLVARPTAGQHPSGLHFSAHAVIGLDGQPPLNVSLNTTTPIANRVGGEDGWYACTKVEP